MNTQKTPVINIDNLLGKTRNRIYRVGVELEGGWLTLPEGVALEHDGSVRFGGGPAAAMTLQEQLFMQAQLDNGRRQGVRIPPQTVPNGPHHIGELPSPPLEIKDIEAWIKKFHPSHVNATCGMHVHASFKNAITYARMMDARLTSTTLHYMRLWAAKENLALDHPIWERLEGRSRFCQHAFYADKQAQTAVKSHRQEGEGHRYTVWNYCYSQHQTCECRLLPMFVDPAQGIRAVLEVVNIINAFLVRSAAREKKVNAEFAIHAGDEVKEEINLCV